MAKRKRTNSYYIPRGRDQSGKRFDYSLALVGISIGIVLVFVPPSTPIGAVSWLIVLFSVLVYPMLHLIEWIFRSPRKSVTGTAIICLSLGVIGFGFRIWPHQGRHLTRDQIIGLGKLADSNPPGIKIMVRVAGNSPEARKYGKEIWDVLYAH